MANVDGAAMHRLGRVLNASAEAYGQPLVAEANAEDRDMGLEECIAANAEIFGTLRRAGSGRDDDVVERQSGDFIPRALIVVDYERLFSVHLSDQLIQIEREGVVVIDDQSADTAQ